MRELECPYALEVTQSLRPGSEVLLLPRLRSHLETCAGCGRLYAESRRLLGLAVELHAPAPDPERMAAVRARLEGPLPPQVRPRSPSWWMASGAASALALAAGLGWLWMTFSGGAVAPPGPDVAEAHRPLEPRAPAAPIDRSPAAPRIVEVKDGHFVLGPELTPDTAPIHLLSGDAEVVAQGARVELEVVAGRLMKVVSLAGRVEVRPTHGEGVVLEPGGVWTPPAPRPLRKGTASKAGAPRSASQPAEGSLAERQERAFAAGWAALRREDPTAAAVQFALAQGLDSASPLAEDAAYWRAVAEVRGHRSDAAIRSFVLFLEAYPNSSRSAEAQVQLGWLYLEQGEGTKAKAAFTAAADAHDPVIARSARRGLDLLERTDTRP